MQHKNKEFSFWGYETNVYFISPDPQTWEEIILPEGRKPFPEANGWAVTLHPTETGMICRGENTHSLAIKTVASRLPSRMKDWKDTEANQSPKMKAEGWKCPSFSRHCENTALPLPGWFVLCGVLLLCCLGTCPALSGVLLSSPSTIRVIPALHCPRHSWPAAVFSPTNNRWKKSNKIQNPRARFSSLGRESGALGSPRCCITKSWCPLAPEPDWLQVHSGQGESCALPCLSWAENHHLNQEHLFLQDRNLCRGFSEQLQVLCVTRHLLDGWSQRSQAWSLPDTINCCCLCNCKIYFCFVCYKSPNGSWRVSLQTQLLEALQHACL